MRDGQAVHADIRTHAKLMTSRDTQTEPLSLCGGPVETLAAPVSSAATSSSVCAAWCALAELSCLLNGISAIVFWRRVVSTIGLSAAEPLCSSRGRVVACYHGLLGGCFFQLVGCQLAVQLALRGSAHRGRSDMRPRSIGTRTAQTSEWPFTLWYVFTVLPVLVTQFTLVQALGDTSRLTALPAFPVFVVALILSTVLAACTLSKAWCGWVVDRLQRYVRAIAVSESTRYVE